MGVQRVPTHPPPTPTLTLGRGYTVPHLDARPPNLTRIHFHPKPPPLQTCHKNLKIPSDLHKLLGHLHATEPEPEHRKGRPGDTEPSAVAMFCERKTKVCARSRCVGLLRRGRGGDPRSSTSRSVQLSPLLTKMTLKRSTSEVHETTQTGPNLRPLSATMHARTRNVCLLYRCR